MISSIPRKTKEITDPKTAETVYWLEVDPNGSWRLYPIRRGIPDYANPITSLQNILDEGVRQQAELELNKKLLDLEADKTFRKGW